VNSLFTEALTRVNKPALLYRARARLHLERQDLRSALLDLQAAILVEPPGLVEDHVSCGHILRLRHRHADAVRAYDEALALGKPDADVFWGRALARLLIPDFAGAQADFTRALTLRPSASIYADRGWLYVQQNALEPGLRDFEEALWLDANCAQAHLGQGYALAKLGRYREAIAAADQAYRLGVTTAESKFNLACAYALATGRAGAALDKHAQQRALEMLRRAVEHHPDVQRSAFWSKHSVDADLDSIRKTAEFKRLEAQFGGPLTP
jgi:tetratricopeptide (TPR) repeat protein